MIGTILVYTNYALLAGSAVWCSRYFKRLLPGFRLLAVFMVLSAVLQLAAAVLTRLGINNLFLSHLYALLGVMTLSGFYRLLLRPFISGTFFSVLIAGYAVLTVTSVLLWQPLQMFNSITLTVEAIVFVILTLSTFVLTLNENMNQHLRSMFRSINWINSGIFLYFAGSLLLFYNGQAIIHAIVGRWSVYTWQVHTALMLVFYLCLLIGLWLSPKT